MTSNVQLRTTTSIVGTPLLQDVKNFNSQNTETKKKLLAQVQLFLENANKGAYLTLDPKPFQELGKYLEAINSQDFKAELKELRELFNKINENVIKTPVERIKNFLSTNPVDAEKLPKLKDLLVSTPLSEDQCKEIQKKFKEANIPGGVAKQQIKNLIALKMLEAKGAKAEFFNPNTLFSTTADADKLHIGVKKKGVWNRFVAMITGEAPWSSHLRKNELAEIEKNAKAFAKKEAVLSAFVGFGSEKEKNIRNEINAWLGKNAAFLNAGDRQAIIEKCVSTCLAELSPEGRVSKMAKTPHGNDIEAIDGTVNNMDKQANVLAKNPIKKLPDGNIALDQEFVSTTLEGYETSLKKLEENRKKIKDNIFLGSEDEQELLAKIDGLKTQAENHKKQIEKLNEFVANVNATPLSVVAFDKKEQRSNVTKSFDDLIIQLDKQQLGGKNLPHSPELVAPPATSEVTITSLYDSLKLHITNIKLAGAIAFEKRLEESVKKSKVESDKKEDFKAQAEKAKKAQIQAVENLDLLGDGTVTLAQNNQKIALTVPDGKSTFRVDFSVVSSGLLGVYDPKGSGAGRFKLPSVEDFEQALSLKENQSKTKEAGDAVLSFFGKKKTLSTLPLDYGNLKKSLIVEGEKGGIPETVLKALCVGSKEQAVANYQKLYDELHYRAEAIQAASAAAVPKASIVPESKPKASVEFVSALDADFCRNKLEKLPAGALVYVKGPVKEGQLGIGTGTVYEVEADEGDTFTVSAGGKSWTVRALTKEATDLDVQTLLEIAEDDDLAAAIPGGNLLKQISDTIKLIDNDDKTTKPEDEWQVTGDPTVDAFARSLIVKAKDAVQHRGKARDILEDTLGEFSLSEILNKAAGDSKESRNGIQALKQLLDKDFKKYPLTNKENAQIVFQGVMKRLQTEVEAVANQKIADKNKELEDQKLEDQKLNFPIQMFAPETQKQLAETYGTDLAKALIQLAQPGFSDPTEILDIAIEWGDTRGALPFKAEKQLEHQKEARQEFYQELIVDAIDSQKITEAVRGVYADSKILPKDKLAKASQQIEANYLAGLKDGILKTKLLGKEKDELLKFVRLQLQQSSTEAILQESLKGVNDPKQILAVTKEVFDWQSALDQQKLGDNKALVDALNKGILALKSKESFKEIEKSIVALLKIAQKNEAILELIEGPRKENAMLGFLKGKKADEKGPNYFRKIMKDLNSKKITEEQARKELGIIADKIRPDKVGMVVEKTSNSERLDAYEKLVEVDKAFNQENIKALKTALVVSNASSKQRRACTQILELLNTDKEKEARELFAQEFSGMLSNAKKIQQSFHHLTNSILKDKIKEVFGVIDNSFIQILKTQSAEFDAAEKAAQGQIKKVPDTKTNPIIGSFIDFIMENHPGLQPYVKACEKAVEEAEQASEKASKSIPPDFSKIPVPQNFPYAKELTDIIRAGFEDGDVSKKYDKLSEVIGGDAQKAAQKDKFIGLPTQQEDFSEKVRSMDAVLKNPKIMLEILQS